MMVSSVETLRMTGHEWPVSGFYARTAKIIELHQQGPSESEVDSFLRESLSYVDKDQSASPVASGTVTVMYQSPCGEA
jgi:hypothetical protein